MISNEQIISIEKLVNKEIKEIKLLSSSFNINCIKILTSNKKNFIVKFYKSKYKNFNAIKSEIDNLIYLNKLNLNSFPKVYTEDRNYLIMSFLNNDGNQPNETKQDLLKAIISLHSCSNDKYGFNFDTQIGGLKQINKKNENWVDFYRNNRLGYIYEIINIAEPMDYSINKKIELLMKKMEEFIPKNPKISLLHGDLWEGNILFNKNNFVGFIDPGSFYGHNELEIAYLRWFNPLFIDKNFLDKYNNLIKIDIDYVNYEPVYQLYYSLLNVHLWDKKYINDVKRLLQKIKI